MTSETESLAIIEERRKAVLESPEYRFVALTFSERWHDVFWSRVDRGGSAAQALRDVEVGVRRMRAVTFGNRAQRRQRRTKR